MNESIYEHYNRHFATLDARVTELQGVVTDSTRLLAKAAEQMARLHGRVAELEERAGVRGE